MEDGCFERDFSFDNEQKNASDGMAQNENPHATNSDASVAISDASVSG